MAQLGTLALLLGMILATYAGAAAVVGARARRAYLVRSARYAHYAVFGAVALASAVLIHAFVSHDFSIRYVQQYSDRSMETFYKVTSFWGGMDGSLLFWLLVLSVYGAVAVYLNRHRHRELIPYVIATFSAVQLFFFILLIYAANPFATFASEIPSDGKGLNPLLQNFYMVFHPPSLYLGFVGMTVPFAFGMAALVTGLVDEAWIRSTRRWMMISWFFLTLGLVLGSLWAYEELGWGGYWGWDPVENAALVPWFTATAFLHSVMIQERRRLLRVWNMVLVVLTFLLTIFGTFLTRSGIVQSVHTFAQSDIGWYFAVFLGIAAVVSTGFIAARLPLLRARDQLESVLSREFAFLVNNWVLLLAAFTVLVLTLFPTLSEAIVGEKITIGPAYFNKWMIPIGLVLLLLTGVGPLMAWRRSTPDFLRRQFIRPVLAGVVTAIASWFWAKDIAASICFGLSGFVIVTITLEFWGALRMRQSATRLDTFTALVGLVARGRRRYGGYIVHIGIVMMFIGWAGNARKVETEGQIKPGESFNVQKYTIRLDELRVTEDAKKEMVTAVVTVFRGKDEVARMHPARWYFRKLPDQPTSEVAIRRTLPEDLYLTLGGFEMDKKVANIRATVNPLVDWFWFGFGVLALGTAIAIAPEGLLARIGVRATSAAPETIALLLILLLPMAARAQMVDPSGAFGRSTKTEMERRVQQALICMCGCSRQTIADCRCGYAAKERAAIGAKVDAGWNEKQIMDWYVNQRGIELGQAAFGNAVLSSPPDNWFNRLAWVVPYASGAAGLGLLAYVGRRITRKRGLPPSLVESTAAPEAVVASATTAATPTHADADRLEDELRSLD